MRALALIALRELSETFGSRGATLRVLLMVLFVPLAMLFLLRGGTERIAGDPVRLAQVARVGLLQSGFLPLMLAVPGVAVSFAVEFEAGTLVPLIAAPVPTWAIFWGKLAAAMVTGISLGWLALGAFVLLFQPVTGLPWPLGSIQVALMSALIAFASLPLLAAAIVLASRVRQVRAAAQSTSLFMFPVYVAVLLIGYRVSAAPLIAIVAVAGGWLLAALVFIGLGVRTWNREELLSRP